MSSQRFISGVAASLCRRSRVDIVVINCCGLCCTKWYLAPTVYTIRSVQVVKSPKFGLFRGLMAPKPYVPHHNSRTKGTFLGCRLALEMIPIAHNCAVWAAALSQTPNPRVPYFGLFWDLKNSLRRNSEIFHRCTHAESDSRLLLQKCSKSVQDKWPKGRVVLITKKTKHVLAPWGGTSGGDFHHFSYVSANRAPSLVFQIVSRQVPVWGSYNRKTCPRSPKVNAV